jgi:hypothetical protein
MKFIITLFLMSSGAAFASDAITSFTCHTHDVIDGKKPTVFEFKVTGLGTKKVDYWVKDDQEYPVIQHPENSVLDLNDNWGITQTEKGLRLDSDGDGCQLTEVVLYKDTNYTHGYARVKAIGGCGAQDAYTKVVCSNATFHEKTKR